MTVARAILVSALLAIAVAVAAAQSFEAVPDTGRLTVGDPIGVRLVLRQYEGDALLEQVPRPEVTLDNGVRLLSLDSMHRVADRLLEARARVAFYRPGTQTLPSFAIDFRRGAVILHGTMRTAPVAIEVMPLLEAGAGARLRDIKEIGGAPGPDPRLIALAVGGGALAAWWWRRRRPRVAVAVPALAVVEHVPHEPDAYTVSLERLREIPAAGWAAGNVYRHDEAVADALRGYLSAAEAVPALERTTSELLGVLPPHLDGSRGRCEAVFSEADQVKFARRRPPADAGADFLARARELLAGWRGTVREGEAADAVR